MTITIYEPTIAVSDKYFWQMETVENKLARQVVHASVQVHKRLGPGLLESVYETCLCYELEQLGLFVQRQKPLPVIYNHIKMDAGYRIDLFVENRLVVEVKSVEAINDLHIAQVLTYLKLSNTKLALLLNFNVVQMKEGMKRLVMGLTE